MSQMGWVIPLRRPWDYARPVIVRRAHKLRQASFVNLSGARPQILMGSKP